MRLLIFLLLVGFAFAEEQYINPTNNTINGDGTINNNVIIQQPLRIDTIEVTDTVYQVINQEGKVLRNNDRKTKFQTIGVQYIFPIVGEGVQLFNDGVGLRMNMIFESPVENWVIGFRIGYAQYNNITIENKGTGVNYIDQLYGDTYGDSYKNPQTYKSLEFSGLIGINRLQVIIGYGYLTDESMFVLGVNFDTYTKVGFTASFNNLMSANKYAPEVGVGLSISF